MKINRRLAFTLVEILCAVTLLVIAASVVGIRLTKGIKRSQFQASKELLQHKLQIAAHLAKLSQSEVKLIIEKENNTYYISTQVTQHEKLIKNYLEKKEALKEITDVQVNGNSDPNNKVSIEVSHRTGFPLTNKLTLFDSYNNAVDIPLSGYTPVEQKLISTDSAIYPHDAEENKTKEILPPH